MHVKLDANAIPHAAAGRVERGAPEARQARWLSELERAMFDGASKKQDAHGSGNDPAPLQNTPFGAALRDDPEPGLQNARAHRGEADGSHTPGLTGNAAAADRAAPAPESTAPERDLPAPADSADLGNHSDGGRGAAFAASVEAVQLPVTPVPGLIAAPGRAGSAAAGPVAVAAAPSAAPAPAALAPLSAHVSLAAYQPLSGLSMTQGPRASAQESGAQLDCETYGKRSAGPTLPEAAGNPFTRTALHIYRSNEGVQAWLRDASLDSKQAEAVRRAMAAELAASGERLLTVTVNGRKSAAAQGPARDHLVRLTGVEEPEHSTKQGAQ